MLRRQGKGFTGRLKHIYQGAGAGLGAFILLADVLFRWQLCHFLPTHRVACSSTYLRGVLAQSPEAMPVADLQCLGCVHVALESLLASCHTNLPPWPWRSVCVLKGAPPQQLRHLVQAPTWPVSAPVCSSCHAKWGIVASARVTRPTSLCSATKNLPESASMQLELCAEGLVLECLQMSSARPPTIPVQQLGRA